MNVDAKLRVHTSVLSYCIVGRIDLEKTASRSLGNGIAVTSANLNRWFCGYNSATSITDTCTTTTVALTLAFTYFVSRHSPISYLLPSIHSYQNRCLSTLLYQSPGRISLSLSAVRRRIDRILGHW